jgi:hypothetical protein
MKLDSLPETIRTIIAQAGGLGTRGAFAWVGASRFKYLCARPDGEYRSSWPSRFAIADGLGTVEFDVGLAFAVNGRPGRDWGMVIAYEPDDLYTVWLAERHAGRLPDTAMLGCRRDVDCESLQWTVEDIYDRGIIEHNEGIIPLG